MMRRRKGEEELEIACVLRRERKYPEGLAMLRVSAELGNPDAMFELYFSYVNGGWGLEKDVKFADQWLKASAEAGSELAQTHVTMETQQYYNDDHLDVARRAYYDKIIDPVAKAYFFCDSGGRPPLNSTARMELEGSLMVIANDRSNLFRFIHANYILGRLRYSRKEDLYTAALNGLAVAQESLIGICSNVVDTRSGAVFPILDPTFNNGMIENSCVQGCHNSYNRLATDINENISLDWSNAAYWRIRYILCQFRILAASAEGLGYLSYSGKAVTDRVSKIAIASWRKTTAGEEKQNTSFISITEYTDTLSSVRLINREQRANEFRELYVYGQLSHDPRIKRCIYWPQKSDRLCCREVFRYSNRLTRKTVITFLGLRKRKAYPLSKDVCSIIGKMVWASRTDPIIWLNN